MSPLAANLSLSNKTSLINLAARLGVDVDWIIYLIHHESRFSTTVVNSIGATGLIQFLPDFGKKYKTINGKQYLMSTIKNMSFQQQCDLIFEYFKSSYKKITSFIDLYMLCFYPAFAFKSLSTKIGNSPRMISLVAKQNPAFNTDKNDYITIGEMQDNLSKKYSFKKKIQI